MSARSPAEAASDLAAFRQGLGQTGYFEGKNVAIEYRWAETLVHCAFSGKKWASADPNGGFDEAEALIARSLARRCEAERESLA
jgi:hypothetical protein